MSDNLLAARRFKALASEWPSEELGRFFWLTPEDMLTDNDIAHPAGQSRHKASSYCFTTYKPDMPPII
jgi:hypothetical protein